MSDLWKPDAGPGCLVIALPLIVCGIVFLIFLDLTGSAIASFLLTIVALSVIGGIIGGF